MRYRGILRAVALVVAVAAVGIILVKSSSPSRSPIRDIEGTNSSPPLEIKLVGVQLRVDEAMYRSRESFAERLRAAMERADEEVSLGEDSLVVFPEDVGLLTIMFGQGDLLSEAEGLADGMERVIRSQLVPVGYRKLRHGVSWPRALFLTSGDEMGEAYFEVFSGLADEYDVYLVAGSVALDDTTLRRFVPDDVPGAPGRGADSDPASVYNVSVLFGPDGEVLGIQRKVNLVDLEGPGGLDLSPGSRNDIDTVSTPLGDIGIAICLDAFDSDILDRLGDADILVQPSANPGPWEPWQQEEWLQSSWSAVVTDDRFPVAINPMLTGGILDVDFFGQSSIIASESISPGPMSSYRDLEELPGFLDVAPDDADDDIIHATVPVSQMRE